ncbi:M56 family metallopeptidase [Hyunsoonleella sp. 2307UL5-6]|uniref:M56 family metallopeptidase n=1 Tax=Hyunsoonleella sp. 2307UL5-6 TaxID=3384768 RepID=UPI0039BD64B2
MFHYIIQTIAFQLLFLIIYDLFLKRETFFNWNRTYLLLTPMLSFIIPLVKISLFRKVIPEDYVINLPEVFIGDAAPVAIPVTDLSPVMVEASNVSWWNVLFFTGMAVVAVVFAFKVVVLVKLILKNPKLNKDKFIIVRLLNSASAFSFFNYIFLGEEIQTKEKEVILKHELVHVNQKHSLDLLFFEGLKIVFWFNPLIYIYQRNVQILHEFIADAEAFKYNNKTQYYQNLLSQVFETKSMSFINPFFKQSLIKKRITMLQKSKSKQVKLLKYALLFPLVFGMLIYTSCEKEPSIENLNEYAFSQNLQEKDMNKTQLEDFKNKHVKFIEFLMSNPDYVGWVDFTNTPKTKSFSIHGLKEKVPERFTSKYTEKMNDGEIVKLRFNFEIAGKRIEVDANEEFKKKKVSLDISKDVPFTHVDSAPVFPECKDLSTISERKKCTSDSITQFVKREFNTKIIREYNLSGRQRMHAIFKIDTDGNIIGVRARASHQKLEEETVRVINTLPRFNPGKQKGKEVTVTYSLPIDFDISE